MTIVKEILHQMPTLGKPQAKFLETLFATILALRGRVNFRNLSRYCDYCERTIARVWSKNSCGLALVVFQEPPKPFMALYRAFVLCLLAVCRKEQDILLPLMIALVMIVLHVLMKCMAERGFSKEDHP